MEKNDTSKLEIDTWLLNELKECDQFQKQFGLHDHLVPPKDLETIFQQITRKVCGHPSDALDSCEKNGGTPQTRNVQQRLEGKNIYVNKMLYVCLGADCPMHPEYKG
jgi:hypothetical protein